MGWTAMTDVEIRPITPDQLEAYCRALEVAFSSGLQEGDLEREASVAIPDRYYAAWDGDRIVGGAASLPKEMTLPGGRSTRVAFVTAVGVQPTHRRRGINTALMRRQLDVLHDQGEDVAALWASEGGIYGRFGYGLGALFAELTIEARRSGFVRGYRPSGRVELVTREAAMPLMRDLYDTVRRTRPGMLDLEGPWFDWRWWQRAREKDTPQFFAIHRSPGGEVDGHAVYTVKHEWRDSIPRLQLQLQELIASTVGAHADLWRFVCDIDLVGTVESWNRPADEPLVWLMAEPRQLRMRLGDALWVRLVDVPRALEQRGYAAAGTLVIDVEDRFCPWNQGRFELRVDEHGAGRCTPTEDEPDLACSVNDLGAVYLGGATLGRLHAASQVRELTPGAIARGDAMLGTWPAPWCTFVL
jgi:predicted acetyltransferase